MAELGNKLDLSTAKLNKWVGRQEIDEVSEVSEHFSTPLPTYVIGKQGRNYTNRKNTIFSNTFPYFSLLTTLESVKRA